MPLLLVTLLGCPPTREDLGDGQSGSTALQLSVYYPSMQASAVTLLMPREDGMECEDPGYVLADDDEDFLIVSFTRGDLYEWPGDYAPNGLSEECSENSNPGEQRCLTSLSGVDSQGLPVEVNDDSLLHITSYTDARVSGSIRSSAGEVEYFNAVNCGERMQYGYTDGDTAPGVGRENQRSPWALRFR